MLIIRRIFRQEQLHQCVQTSDIVNKCFAHISGGFNFHSLLQKYDDSNDCLCQLVVDYAPFFTCSSLPHSLAKLNIFLPALSVLFSPGNFESSVREFLHFKLKYRMTQHIVSKGFHGRTAFTSSINLIVNINNTTRSCVISYLSINNYIYSITLLR